MCTLTLLPFDPRQRHDTLRVRVACNRDESVLRPAAIPPRLGQFGARHGSMPVDPAGGGTWIGVNDAALVMSLLNAHTRPPGKAPLSRGLIIPGLLECGSLDEAIQHAMRLESERYSPFRLVITNGREVAELAERDGKLGVIARGPLTAPVMFTSSALDESLVAGPRRQLFRELFPDGEHAWQPATQNAYHRHQWPEAPQFSVCMDRPEAQTVSLTVVELTAREATLTYWPVPPNKPSEPIRVEFALHGADEAT